MVGTTAYAECDDGGETRNRHTQSRRQRATPGILKYRYAQPDLPADNAVCSAQSRTQTLATDQMIKCIVSAIDTTGTLCFTMIDASLGLNAELHSMRKQILRIKKAAIPDAVILVINKIDLIPHPATFTNYC